MASSIRIARLKGEAAEAVKNMKSIAVKADEEARELTADEQGEFDKFKAQAEELVKNIEAARHDVEVIAAAESLAKQVGAEPVEEPASDGATKARAKSLGLQVVGSAQFKSALAPFKGTVPERSRFQTDPIAVKGLLVGGSPTSAGAFVTPERTDIVEMLGRRDLTIRDLISVRRTGSDLVEYVAQTSHTNAAAAVPEATSSAAPTAPASGGGALIPNTGGGYKPEGSWAFERMTAAVKTVAEWVPATKRALADVAALEGLINDELRADIAEKEEALMLTGSGVGEDLLGINATSGVQTQAFSTDFFGSVRKAITKVRTIGRVAPSAIVVSPEDAELIDLAKDLEGRYVYGGPFAFGNRTLWGVPVVESEAQPTGTALLGDFSKAVLWDREQTTVTVTDSHADFFIRNMVAVLAEERVAFAVTRPSAFVKVATHA